MESKAEILTLERDLHDEEEVLDEDDDILDVRSELRSRGDHTEDGVDVCADHSDALEEFILERECGRGEKLPNLGVNFP